jgi:hypothetical protein
VNLNRILTGWTIAPIIALVSLSAYLPAFNNGFVADDYATLVWGEKFVANPLVLFTVPPQNFRMMSHAAFASLKWLFGYNAAGFYAFNLIVHFVVCLLLWRLLLHLTDPETAGLTALFFSIFQAPQEAVMWLSAMNETLAGLFGVATLLLWAKDRYGWASLTYVLAMLSKESASVLPLLALIVHWRQGKPLLNKGYLWLALPLGAFFVTFLATESSNHMIQAQDYALGFHVFAVILRSMHRLFWPWMYGAVLLVAALNRRWPAPRNIAGALAAVVAAMLPYAFIVYDKHLESRHVYLAAMVFALMLATLVQQLKRPMLRTAVIASFCVFNILYIGIKKDRGFEERAAPTTALLDVLKSQSPSPIRIEGFPYAYVDIAKDVAWLAPGWTPDLIDVSNGGQDCPHCVILRWDPSTRRYIKRSGNAGL